MIRGIVTEDLDAWIDLAIASDDPDGEVLIREIPAG